MKWKRGEIFIETAYLKTVPIFTADASIPPARNLADFNKIPGLRVEDWLLCLISELKNSSLSIEVRFQSGANCFHVNLPVETVKEIQPRLRNLSSAYFRL